MHSSLDEHSGLAFNLFLGISAAAFLMILASGIAMSNVVAAVIAGAGLAVIIVVGGTINLVPDSMRSQATERTLSVA
ncbi:MAG: sensor histidine kinase, partial [Olsenella sp.]